MWEVMMVGAWQVTVTHFQAPTSLDPGLRLGWSVPLDGFPEGIEVGDALTVWHASEGRLVAAGRVTKAGRATARPGQRPPAGWEVKGAGTPLRGRWDAQQLAAHGLLALVGQDGPQLRQVELFQMSRLWGLDRQQPLARLSRAPSNHHTSPVRKPTRTPEQVARVTAALEAARHRGGQFGSAHRHIPGRGKNW